MTPSRSCHCGHTWAADPPAGGTAVVCPGCGSPADAAVTLDGPPASAGHTETVGATTAAADGPAPEVPGYAILGELGRGGMGVVYKAREASLNRAVALKVLLSGAHAGGRDLARFLTESSAAAAVQHPNVVTVYAVGQHGGLPFMAQELVPGGSLAARLACGPLPPAEAARVVEAVARGVQAIHDRSIIHRDLKPANVLFAADGEPKVADFGLAKVVDVSLTASGAVMGTPAYMAPEQARGDTRHVGPATDVWALGTMLLECLMCRPPFRGDSVPETFRLVCEADPVVPTLVPRDLRTIALKCLEKDPARRYPSAAAVADDLARYRAGQPISARRPGPAARAARWVRRHPGPAYLAAGAVLAATVVYAVYPRPKVEPVPVVQQPPPAEPDDDPRPTKKGAVGKVQAAANRMKTQNNIRQLAIAAHNLNETYTHMPPDAIYDPKTGRPLLSWRVAYLPFIEEGELYKQFHRDEPWDSPHNMALLDKMPTKFEVAGTDPPKGHTYFQVFTGPGTLFDPARMRPGGPFGKTGPSFKEITDGPESTALIVEAATAVPWTKPADLVVAPDRPLPALGGHFDGGCVISMADGRTLFASDRVSEATWRAVLSPRARDTVGPDWPYGPEEKK